MTADKMLISGLMQIPSGDQVQALSAELRERSTIPAHIPKVLAAMAPDTHPMVQFSTAVNCLQVLARRLPTLLAVS